MKCAVKNCTNHFHEGEFIGLLCKPCHTFITGDGGLYSQAYRNFCSMIDTAIEMEREACAKLVEESSLPDAYSEPVLLEIANDIRARGKK